MPLTPLNLISTAVVASRTSLVARRKLQVASIDSVDIPQLSRNLGRDKNRAGAVLIHLRNAGLGQWLTLVLPVRP